METTIIKGTDLADKVKTEVQNQITEFKARGIAPCLAVVVTGHDPSAQSYLKAKQQLAESLGVRLDVINFSESADQAQLEQKLIELSADPSRHGIMVESPLRAGLDALAAMRHIDPKKDVDGLTPFNLGLALSGREEQAMLAPTPQACLKLCESVTDLSGKKVTLVGRGRTVGRPLIPLLLNRHATLTVCHTKTVDLKAAVQAADVVIVGVGKPKLITADYLGEGQIIIDAGINVLEEKIVGDVDFDRALGKAAAITPVPGGVGVLTTALIFQNLIKAVNLQNQT